MKFENKIKNHDNIVECHLLSGGYDYLLKYFARSVSRYQKIMEDLLERNIEIDKYFSYIVIKPVVEKHSVPIQDLVNRDWLNSRFVCKSPCTRCSMALE